MKKRIVAVLLLVALLLPCFTVAHATNPLEYVRKSFWEYVYDFSHEIGNDAATVWSNTIGAFWDGFNGTPEQAYGDYVQHVVDTIGTPIVGRNGYIIPLVPAGYWLLSPELLELHSLPYPSFSRLLVGSFGNNISSSILLNTIYSSFSFVVPEASILRVLSDAYTSNPAAQITSFDTSPLINGQPSVNGSVAPANSVITIASSLFGTKVKDTPFAIYFRSVLFVEPISWNVGDFTAPVGGSGSRLTNTGINIMGSDNTVYENVTIVNETNNTYYDPSTGTTHNILDWTYDYGDRSYSLSLEGGAEVSVRWGDDSLTIREGDTIVNNYYYAAPAGSGGGGEPEPTNPPTSPQPTIPPAGGGDGEDDGGWLDWLPDWVLALLAGIGIRFIFDRLKSLADKIQGDFGGFFGSFWGIMPPEFSIILEVFAIGVVLTVLVAILRKLFR